MCYTGGPRCYKDAKKALIKAKDDYSNSANPETKEALENAKKDYLLTPKAIAKVREQDPDKADKLQAHYDKKLEGAKDYERYRSESSSIVSRLQHEKNAPNKKIEKINKEIQLLEKQIEYFKQNAEIGSKGGNFIDDERTEQILNEIDGEIQEYKESKSALMEEIAIIQSRINTVEQANQTNLERRKKGLPLQHSHLMPEKFAGYFADTEKKHFNAESAGSTFTEAKNLNEVLTLAARQRGGLDGDDRYRLMARGADPESFGSDKRYLMVETKGKLGTVLASELKDDATVKVIQKSEKSKPVCVTEVSQQSETDFGTIVLVDDPTLPGTEKHPSLLITAYPGASGPTGSNNDLLPYVGKSMTVSEARKIYGRDFTINTVVK